VPWIENPDVRCVLDDLCKLQKNWERKIPDYAQQGKGPWASGVLFAIEIALQRIEEDCEGSLIKLNTLLAQWERIASGEEVGTAAAAESISGLDFGIRLVIDPRTRMFGSDACAKTTYVRRRREAALLRQQRQVVLIDIISRSSRGSGRSYLVGARRPLYGLKFSFEG
jgi:hypothetical protein